MRQFPTSSKRARTIISGIVLSLLLISEYSYGQGRIDVEFHNLPSNEGQVIFMLFNNESGFPKATDQAFKIEKVKISDQKASSRFEDLPFGEYAISAIHDENSDGVVETNWMGMPKEKVGISGQAEGRPSFQKASFQLSKNEQTKEISFEPFSPFKR